MCLKIFVSEYSRTACTYAMLIRNRGAVPYRCARPSSNKHARSVKGQIHTKMPDKTSKDPQETYSKIWAIFWSICLLHTRKLPLSCKQRSARFNPLATYTCIRLCCRFGKTCFIIEIFWRPPILSPCTYASRNSIMMNMVDIIYVHVRFMTDLHFM